MIQKPATFASRWQRFGRHACLSVMRLQLTSAARTAYEARSRSVWEQSQRSTVCASRLPAHNRRFGKQGPNRGISSAPGHTTHYSWLASEL